MSDKSGQNAGLRLAASRKSSQKLGSRDVFASYSRTSQSGKQCSKTAYIQCLSIIRAVIWGLVVISDVQNLATFSYHRNTIANFAFHDSPVFITTSQTLTDPLHAIYEIPRLISISLLV